MFVTKYIWYIYSVYKSPILGKIMPRGSKTSVSRHNKFSTDREPTGVVANFAPNVNHLQRRYIKSIGNSGGKGIRKKFQLNSHHKMDYK